MPKSEKSVSGYFVILEGIDGCGKTTIATELNERLRDDGYRTFLTNWKDTRFREALILPIYKLVDSTYYSLMKGRMKSNHISFDLPCLLDGLTYSLVYYGIVVPALEESKIVIADGWCRRSMLKHLLYDSSSKKMNEIDPSFFERVWPLYSPSMKEDLVILLSANPETCWKWKGADCTDLEAGILTNSASKMESFMNFQTMLQRELLQMAKRLKWPVVNRLDVPLAQGGKATTDVVYSLLDDALRRRMSKK